MVIHLQVFSMQAINYIYITMHKQKASINMFSRSKASKTQQVAGYKHKKKTSRLFMVPNRGLF